MEWSIGAPSQDPDARPETRVRYVPLDVMIDLVWIDLTAPSYGIHGTPSPDGKTESHGCIRLTNWDTVDLAAMVRPGTVARFEDLDYSPVAPVSVSQGRRPETRRQPP
jgi:hypothetical protein